MAVQHASRTQRRGVKAHTRGGAQGKATRHKHATFAAKKEGGGADAEAEPFVVVIRNVETDFAKVHSALLPSFCGLDTLRQRRPQPQRCAAVTPSLATPAPDDASALLTTARPSRDDAHSHGAAQAGAHDAAGACDANTSSVVADHAPASPCLYTLSCRTETRSAELAVFGDADSDVACIFASHSPSPSGATRDGGGDDNNNTKDAVAAKCGIARLKQMCTTVRRRPYVQYPLKVHMHVCGCGSDVVCRGPAATEVHPRGGGDNVVDDGDDVAGATVCARDATVLPADAAHDDNNNDGNDDDDDDANDTTQARATPDDGGDGAHDVDSTKVGSNSSRGSGSTAASRCEARQAALVTAEAVVSANMPTRELRRRLHDVPGFVSCWPLRTRHFRVVFVDATALFKAKQLLDQFEIDGSVRVTLHLSDALQRRHDAFAAL